LFVEKKDK
jgi:hypothetical protein